MSALTTNFLIAEEAGRRFKVRADLHSIKFGLQHLDLNCVEQLLDPSQTRAIASILRLFMRLIKQPGREGRTLAELLEGLQSQIDAQVVEAQLVKRNACACVVREGESMS